MSLRKTRAGIARAAFMPLVREHYRLEPSHLDIYGPVCDICNELVDSETIVEGYPGERGPGPHGFGDGEMLRLADSETCKVLVRHHGAEELHIFDFESREWSPEDLRRRMQHRRWFSPLEDRGEVAGSNFSQVPK
jgi:hypothetical protein